jgi:hypothetical protein
MDSLLIECRSSVKQTQTQTQATNSLIAINGRSGGSPEEGLTEDPPDVPQDIRRAAF